LAGTTGLEPATSDVTGRRSNQLNYVPDLAAFLMVTHQGDMGLPELENLAWENNRVIALAVLVALAVVPQSPVVARMWSLFDRLRAAEVKSHKGVYEKVSFRLSEAEVNDYLVQSLKTQPRPGLESVNIKFFPSNYTSTFTVINFDAVEKWRPGTIPMLLRPVLTGSKAVWVDIRFGADSGRATFSIEKAYFQGIRLPAILVQKVIEIVAARQPEHYDTSKAVPLPFGLKKLWTTDKTLAGEN
jgi:hypothetical protein